MSSVRTLAGAMAVALGSAVLLAPSAEAEWFIHKDPAGDMATWNGKALVIAKQHHNFDIRRVLVRHTPHRVIIRVKFVRLHIPPGPATTLYGLQGFARVNRKAMPYQNLKDGPWQWEARIFKRHPYRPHFFGVLDAQNEEQTPCYVGLRSRHGLRARVNYDKNFIALSYPRRCFAPENSQLRPQWIRVSVSSETTGRLTPTSRIREFGDQWVFPDRRREVLYYQHYYLSPRLSPAPR